MYIKPKRTYDIPQKGLSVFFLLFLSILLLLTGCSNFSQDSSLLAKFDKIDTCIVSKQYGEAFSLLKQAEKKAHGVYNQLGIIKRAFKLAENDWAEALLIKTLNKYPDNLETRAVYTHLLLRTNRYAQALSVGAKLKGTAYGSLYAEAIIYKQQMLIDTDSTNTCEKWQEEEFVPLFIDLYKTTENEKFLINSAVIYLKQGDYAKAFTFHPEKISVYDNTYFWSLVSYDSQNWDAALDDLSCIPDIEQAKILEADTYVQSGQIDNARQIWDRLMSDYPAISITAYLNAARQSRLNGNFTDCYDCLKAALVQFPESVPVLSAWGDYALLSSKPYTEDSMDSVLRLAGLKTLSMEERDAIPKVLPIDALHTMKDVLTKTNSPELQLSYTKLLWEVDKVEGDKRCSDMWLLLEKNRLANKGTYDANLCRYAIWLFLHNAKYDYAQSLLSYLPDASTNLATVHDVEMEAWLAYKKGSFSEAVKLYETIPELNSTEKASYVSSYSALFNLGALYVANGEKLAAQSLYETALPITENNLYASELEYRIARIQMANGQTEEALKSLQFCLKKNPANNRARLLKKKLSQN
jgi:tetratricopeptide (TPR) repeat protein